MKKNTNILFISDGSLSNPIISSQGLPLLEFLSLNGFKSHILTFEHYLKTYDVDIESKYRTSLKFYKIFIKGNIFPDWLNILIKGLFIVKRIIKDNDISIIHARSFMPALISLAVKKLSNRKIDFIYDNRGLFVEEQIYIGKWDKNGLKIKFAEIIESLIFENCSKVVVVSDQFRKYLSNRYERKYDPKITVIRNRTKILPLKFAPVCESKKIIGVFSGSGARWQNIPELNNLIKTASHEFPDIEFRIFAYNDDYQIETNEIPLKRSNVEILNLKPEVVNGYMQEGDFGILLREKIPINEVSSPLKFSEYLSCGLPVLLTPGIGDTEDIIKKYKVGVVISDNNYIKALDELMILLKDPGIKNRCLLVAEKEFNISDSFNEYISIYKELKSE